jgi:CheY-like chemotaxis protein
MTPRPAILPVRLNRIPVRARMLLTIAPTVLIVDDDEEFRRIVGILLRSSGLEIAGEASDVVHALRACALLRPDAALIDVNLPDGYGPALAAELMGRMPELRVLLTSSDAVLKPGGGIPFVAKADLPEADLGELLG